MPHVSTSTREEVVEGTSTNTLPRVNQPFDRNHFLPQIRASLRPSKNLPSSKFKIKFVSKQTSKPTKNSYNLTRSRSLQTSGICHQARWRPALLEKNLRKYHVMSHSCTFAIHSNRTRKCRRKDVYRSLLCIPE